MEITFIRPVTVGDISSQITIASMKITTIAFNLDTWKGEGFVGVGITLKDEATGHSVYIDYHDAKDSAEYWAAMETQACPCGCGKPWPQHLLERMIADGKLPAGSISLTTSASTLTPSDPTH
jgi:hypothetical protein